MKLKILFFIVIFFTVNILFSNENDEIISKLNNSHLPYLNSKLEFNIVGPKLDTIYKNNKGIENNIGKINKIITLRFVNNEYFIELDKTALTYVESNSNLKLKLDEAKADIEMLVKYLDGFYYSKIINNDFKLIEKNDTNYTFQYNYMYKNNKCINNYYFQSGELKEVFIYKTDSFKADVSIKYGFLKKDNKYYLNSFHSINNLYNFEFICKINYFENNNLIVPREFIIEIIKKGKSTKFKYFTFNNN